MASEVFSRKLSMNIGFCLRESASRMLGNVDPHVNDVLVPPKTKSCTPNDRA